MAMKNAILRKNSSWLLALGLVSMLSLSACKSADEHPHKTEHPTQEHPTPEHPTTNAPAKP